MLAADKLLLQSNIRQNTIHLKEKAGRAGKQTNPPVYRRSRSNVPSEGRVAVPTNQRQLHPKGSQSRQGLTGRSLRSPS